MNKFLNIRNISIIVLALIIFSLWKSCEKINELKVDNSRLKENQLQMINYSDHLKELKLTAEEIKKGFPEISKTVKPKNINSITTIEYRYIDTSKKELLKLKLKYDSIENSLCNGRNLRLADVEKLWQDSTKCLVVAGRVVIKNDSLKVEINKREFKNNSTAVAYIERKQWKWWFIKSSFLGKWQAAGKITDSCGETKMMHVEVVK